MTLALVSTCVGGRRAGQIPPIAPPPLAPVIRIHTTPRRRHLASLTPPGQKWGLTDRECEVVDAAIEADGCKPAARALGLSIKTVESHMLNVRRKVGVKGNYKLIAVYVAAKYEGLE